MATKDFEKDISQQTGFYAAVQKKTFTKWVNSHLGKVGLKVNDLYEDFRDGNKLLSLLEVLSDKKFKREKGKMKIHHVQNIQRGLDHLEKDCKIKLVNIGSGEIQQGDAKLTLGLVWQLILHFQMSAVVSSSGNQGGIKESLLKWVQNAVDGYDEVEVRNFSSSWKDGMAFCAVIDRHRPDLIDYESCDPANPVENMNKAFQVAEDKFGIIRLLDPEDVAKAPEEKSIMTYVSYLYHQFPVTPPLRRKKGPAVSLADYTVIFNEMKHWVEDKTKQFKERNFPNDVKQIQAMLVEFDRFKNEELVDKSIKKQELADTEKKLLAQKIEVPAVLTMSEMDKLWSSMELEMNNYEKAMNDKITSLQKLEEIAVKINEDCDALPARIADLAGHYKEFVGGCEEKEFTVITEEHQKLQVEVEDINKVIGDISERVQQLEQQHYSTDAIKARLKSASDQHRTVTDSNGILGRCVTELMWCVTQQHAECSRVYHYPEVTTDTLSNCHQEFKVQLTQHDVPLIVHEAKQCITQGYSFADIIEVVSTILNNCYSVTVKCCEVLKCHVEHYDHYCKFVVVMEEAERELAIIEQSIEKHWNDGALTDTQKREILENCNEKVERWADKMRPLQEQCQNIYPYNVRVGPLPSDKTTVVSLCDCPQLQLEAGKEYRILGDITGRAKWKVSVDGSTSRCVCSTLLHLPPPSQWLMDQLQRNGSQCDRLSSTITVRLEQAAEQDQADKVIQSLKELMSWLQPMVSQLDQQAPVADTMEQLQVQCNWLKDCEDRVNRREPEISQVLDVQLKLQSGPRLEQYRQLKNELTVMWTSFNDKRAQWSAILEAAQRCFTFTAVAEASVKSQELWILRKGKHPKNQRVLQYIQDVKLFIEEDISKCSRDVKQMTDEYSAYSQAQGGDHDELRRRIDVVNDHWSWLKRIVNRYEHQHKPISSQTEKFDDEYRGHLTWSAMIIEYVNDLPKLSVELEQLQKHKEELEEKAEEARSKEGEVDNIETSSRFFEASLQPVNEEYDEYRKKLANCSSPVTIEDSEIEQLIPSASHDPSSEVQEGSIVDQATSVKEQWVQIVERLKLRLEECNSLIKKLNAFKAKYNDNVAFIEEGEKLIAECHHPGEEPSVTQDPLEFAEQLEKCLEFKKRKHDEQQRHSAMLEEGRKINELSYIDFENDLGQTLNAVIDRWYELNRAFDSWYDDMTEAQENFKQWDSKLKDFIDKLSASAKANPLPVELEPSNLLSQVDKAKDTFTEQVWPLLEELEPLVDDLEANKSSLTDPQKADDSIDKYRDVYETAKQQKSQLEEIKKRADNYAEPFELISKWITDTDQVLMKSKPLSAVPPLAEEQLTTIKSIEEELREKRAVKDKLLEDTSYIAAQQQSVTPDRLNQVKQDFEDTWKAIEEQVMERGQKAEEACDKLKECCAVMQPLEKWLKEAEEKAKQLGGIAKSKARLEKQSHDLKEFIDDVKEHSTDMKSTESSKDQFVELAQDYERTLEQYSSSPAELEGQFTRMAGITYAHNTKRLTSSAGELGRNVLAQDVNKLRQRYDKLLSALEKKQAKLQEIGDKHAEVMRVADDAEGTLNSIQARTDDLTSQTDWSQPALLQQHMIVAEDLRKECRTLEQGEVAGLKRVFHELEKARQDTPGEYSNIAADASDDDEDDAEQRKTSITEALRSLDESLKTAKATLDKAHGKLTTMNQAANGFMAWLEDTERKLRNISPDQVTLQSFEEVAERCNAIADDVNNHETQYDDIIEMIENYLAEFGDNPDVKDKSENLTRRWNQLQEDLYKKKEDYEREVEGLKTLEGNMAAYDEWLKEEDAKVVNLPPLAWSLELLKQQREDTKALLDELESRYEEDYDKGIHPRAVELISPYEELDCEGINKRISEEADKYDGMVEVLNNRLSDIDSRSEAVDRLLTDQQGSSTSLSKISDHIDDIPVNSLSSADVDKLLSDLQSLKDQFSDEKGKVEEVVKRCDEISTAVSSPHDQPDLYKSPPPATSPDYMESSVDPSPTPDAAAQGEGLSELQGAVKSLEEECTKVEEKLKSKEVRLGHRKEAVEKFDDKFNKFHRELDDVAGRLSNSQPVLNDDDAVKEQIDKTEKLVVEIQQMEPALQVMCEDASLLLEAADTKDQSTLSFQASLDDEKKRYQDTLDTAMATSDMLKSESSKVQEVYKLLLPLKSWLSEQEDKMNSMKPAAVLSPPLAAQITENEQFGKEVKSKEAAMTELKNTSDQLGDKSNDHPVHKTVGEITEQYQTLSDNIRSRGGMLLQFQPRVTQYEQLVEQCSQWLADCCNRVDELPVVAMSTDQLSSQLQDVEQLRSEVADKEPQCAVAKDCCDQLCNDPTDSIGGVAEASMITPDYHPAADTARLKVTELDQSLEQLKKKLRDRENKLKQQQDRVKKHQDAVNEVGQWLDEKEHQLKDYDLTEVEPAKIQEKMSAIKMIQEEQANKQSLVDSLAPLLADVVTASSSDDPLKEQLEGNNEELRKRWQQLISAVEDRYEALTDALRLAEKYKEDKAKVEQWMADTNAKLDTMGPPPSNPKEAEKELNKIKAMRDEYEDLRPTHTTCCDTATTLAGHTTDPSVTEQLNTAVKQLQDDWDKLEDRLTEADNKLGNALGKASDLDRRLEDISNWLTEMLEKFNHPEPCAARVYLLNDQISEAKATLEEISSRADSIQVVQNIGQEVMSQCSPQDKNEIQPKLNKITTNFADVEEMAKLRLEELNNERVKAEDYEKQASDLDDWLKDKEAIAEQFEEFAIDSAALEQQMEKIGVFEVEVNNGYPVVTSLNDSERTLLATDLETIRQYEKAFPNGPPDGKRRDSKELKAKDGSGFKRKSSKREKDKKLESSVDKPQLPDFAKRQGAQEAVDEGKKLRKRYEDLKRRTDNRLAEVQDLLRRVQDYETALGSFGDWLREEKGIVNLIESFASTNEGINTELAKIKEAKGDFQKKKKDLEHLCKTGTALIDGCKVEESRKFAEKKLQETNNRWGDLLKSLDDKKQSLLAKQKEVEHYMNLLGQFSKWMDSVELRLEEPIDLVGDPHKIADKLDEMKELAQEITDHKPQLNTMVHAGKVAEYPGPAEEADAQPNRPQSGYSIAIKRYEDAAATCQDRIHQIEETLNKISEVKNDIEKLILSLNQCKSKISNSGRLRAKPDDAKAQLTTAKELDEEVNELQPSIEEKETTGQQFAVLPLATAATASSGDGEEDTSSPHHDGDDVISDSKSPTPTPAEVDRHPTVPTGKSLKELLEQLAQLNSAVKEMSTVKLKQLEDRLEQAEKFEQDYHDAAEWFRVQQEELSNAGSVRGVPDGIKEQIALHMEFQDMIEGKKAEIVALKNLAEDLKEGVPEIDKDYLNEQLADLDNTVAILAKGCVKHQQELEDGLKRSNNFHDKLLKAIASVNEKKAELAKIPPANLDTPSVKAKLDQLNAFQISLKGVSSQVSEVMTLGQQLKDSCSDVDDPELDKRLKELNVLWTELNSDLQQRIQYLQGILLRLGQFHEDLGKFLTWIDDVNSNLQAAPPPGVEPPEVEKKITKLEEVKEDVTCHQPELATLFQAADELMAEANDPGDTTCDKLRHYKKDTEQRWNGLEEAVTKRRGQLEKALEKAEEFRVAFQQETMWLNSADDRLTMEWSPRGLPDKCKEEIEQHKVFTVEVHSHNEPIIALMPLGEGLKPQGSKAEKKMVDTWLKGLQDGVGELDKAMIEKKGQLQTALSEAEHFEGSYNVIVQWVDASTKAQEEAEPIKSELDAVQKQLESHKATLKEVSAKEDELNVVMTTGQSLNNKCLEEDGEVIMKLLEELHVKWDNLNTLLTHRKTQLEEALLTLGQFQQAFDELWAWLTAIHEQLSNPSPISGKIDTVNTLITKHSAVQKQLGAKQSTHKAVGKAGKQVLSQKSGEDAETLQKKLDELEQKWNEVCQMSANWQQRLESTRDELRQFNVLIVPLQKFLAKVTPRLSASEPVYGNKDTVERLIDSHQQLQKELGGQNKKVEATKTSGEKLVNDLLDNPEPVKGSLELMSNRWDEACKASETRQNRLDQALLEAKVFEASYDDALEWVQIKSGQLASQLAPQEDATALQKQIEEQKAYSAEILAKQPEIDKVLEKGEQLLEEAHPDAVPILQNMIQELQDGWKELKKMASDRSEELATALLELQGVEEMLIQLIEWVEGARKTLAGKQAQPIGETLAEVEAQLAEHESFQEDMAAQQPNMEALQKVARRRRGTGGNQDMIRKINDLQKKWQKLWLGATDRHRVLTDARMRLKDIAKARSFNYDSWRQRFLDFSSQQKLRLNNLFIKFDANHDRKLNREEFINALKSSGLPMSRIELEKVADVFFPDRRALHLVDVSEIVAKLTQKHDWKKVENESDAVKIEREIQREISKCTCASRFKVEQIGEGKYRFGDSQRPYLVRILRTTVMVRVGGGWTTLTEFLQKHDPCRANTRTNLELYKEIRGKKPGLDTVEFQSKVETKKKAKNEAVRKAAMEDPEAEVKTRFLPSGRKATEIAKRTVLEHGETKHVVEGTDISVPTVQAKSRRPIKSTGVDHVPRQKHVLTKKLDREKLKSPPKAIPLATGHSPHSAELHHKGASMIPRVGMSPRSPNLSHDSRKHKTATSNDGATKK